MLCFAAVCFLYVVFVQYTFCTLVSIFMRFLKPLMLLLCSSTISVTDSNFHNMVQIGMLEDLRQRTLQGVTRLQALYKGYKVRLMYRQKRKMTIYLQSCKFSLSVSPMVDLQMKICVILWLYIWQLNGFIKTIEESLPEHMIGKTKIRRCKYSYNLCF